MLVGGVLTIFKLVFENSDLGLIFEMVQMPHFATLNGESYINSLEYLLIHVFIQIHYTFYIYFVPHASDPHKLDVVRALQD